MVLRIERVSHERLTILRLSGRLQLEHVEQLKSQIEASAQRVVLDLEGVKLVDQDSVCFLAACETKGVKLSCCSPYIRDWINREKTSRSRGGA
jgi:anti-anti-sigma regulatory factor